MLKKVKRELLIYFGTLVVLSLAMHPERVMLIEEPARLVHPFLYTFPVYLAVCLARYIYYKISKRFKKDERTDIS